MWDYEADVVIIGYGCAGSTAAISAYDRGASVIILEKNAAGGGNTKYSGGSIRTFLDKEKSVDFIEAVCEGATDREIAGAFVQESSQNAEWLTSIGGVVGPSPLATGYPQMLPGAAFPSIPGADAIGPRLRISGAGEARGKDLWRVLSQNVDKRKIPVRYSTSAKRLSTGKSGEVTGVTAVAGEKELKIGAKRAVVLASGGFESDHSMHLTYLGQRYLFLGNPGNSGDGIRLATDIGADLWHMNAVAACFGYKFDEFECAIIHWMPTPGFIYADQSCRRFMDEAGTDIHAVWSVTSFVDMKTLEKPRVPCYVIFDEKTRTKGPVGGTNRGEISQLHQWSLDNSTEIKNGWIMASETVGGLAQKIKLGPDSLQRVIDQYNSYCASGYDPDYGRSPDTLIPLDSPPFYAIAMWPSLFNTQGGPKRNAKSQVLDVWGNSIKRLYSAGELGSLWNRNYPGGGNITEALAFGRIAGKNAAAEPPLA